MKRSQCFQILKYLKKGNTLTGLKALRLFGTMKLSTRVGEINNDLDKKQSTNFIKRDFVKFPSGKWGCEYWI